MNELVQRVSNSLLRIDECFVNESAQSSMLDSIDEDFYQELDPLLEDWDHLVRSQEREPGLRGNLRSAKANRKLLKSKKKVESQLAAARVSLTFVHDCLELLGPAIAIANRQLGTNLRVSITWSLTDPVHLALLRAKKRAYSVWELEPTRTTRAGRAYRVTLPAAIACRLRLAKDTLRFLSASLPPPAAREEHGPAPSSIPDPGLAPCACAIVDAKFRTHPSGHVWTYDRKFVFELGDIFGFSLDFTSRLFKLLSYGLGHRERQRFNREIVRTQLDSFVEQVCRTFESLVKVNEIRTTLERLCREILSFAEADDSTPTPVTATEEFAKFMNVTSHLWGIRRCDKATNNFAFVCEWLLEHLTTADLESQPSTFECTKLLPAQAAELITGKVHQLGWWFREEEVNTRIDEFFASNPHGRPARSLFDRFPDIQAKPSHARTKYPGLLDKGAFNPYLQSAPPLRRSKHSGLASCMEVDTGFGPDFTDIDIVSSSKSESADKVYQRFLNEGASTSARVEGSSPEGSIAYMTQLVKAHKNPPALRFLNTSQFCATTRLSKWLQGGLKAIREERVRLCDHLFHLTGVSFNFTIDESADVLVLAPPVVSSINVDDFTRLYTSLPIHDPDEGLVAAVKFWANLTLQFAKRRLGPNATLVASLDGQKWSWRSQPSSNPLEINTDPALIERCFLIEASNNYFVSAFKVWLQINGIPMGSSTSVDACDLLLGKLEFLAQWSLLCAGQPKLLLLAEQRNPNFRFVDDHLSFNNPEYLADMVRIFNLGKYLGIEDQSVYPEDTNNSQSSSPACADKLTARPRGSPGIGGNFMDLSLSIEPLTGRLVTKFYQGFYIQNTY